MIRVLATAIGVISANYVWQLVTGHQWSVALEHSWFQGIVFVLWGVDTYEGSRT